MKELCLEKSMWEGGPQIPCPLQVHPCPSTIPEASSGRCNGSLTALGAFLAWRRAWQPTPVFSPGEFHGQCSLEDYCPQGHMQCNTTEVTQHEPLLRDVEQAADSNFGWSFRCIASSKSPTRVASLRTKDPPVTQEDTSSSVVPCEEPESRSKHKRKRCC